jgi:hypothetical protein
MGDVSATTLKKKGVVLWGSVEKAVQISAGESIQIIDDIELKGASASGRILSTLILSETARKAKPSDSLKKQQQRKQTPVNEEPPVVEDEPAIEDLPADAGKAGNTGVDSTKQK